jgi:hypothetical protein
MKDAAMAGCVLSFAAGSVTMLSPAEGSDE